MAGFACQTADELIQFLDSIGWFRLFNQENRQQYIERLRYGYNPCSGSAVAVANDLIYQFPAVFDAETIYDEGDFTGLLKVLEDHACGLFRLEEIDETWEELEEGEYIIHLSFQMNGRRYQRSWEWSGTDWVDEQVFELLGQALAECQPPLRHLVDDGGNESHYLVNEAAVIETLLSHLPQPQDGWRSIVLLGAGEY